MRRSIHMLALASVLGLMCESCDQTEIEVPKEALRFELYSDVTSVEEGRSVTDIQELKLNETRTYILKSQYVTQMKISEPDGWACRFYPASEEAIITAPQSLADTVETFGIVKVELQSGRGEKMEYQLEVRLSE